MGVKPVLKNKVMSRIITISFIFTIFLSFNNALASEKNIASQATITYNSISTSSYGGYTPKAQDTVDGKICGSSNHWSAKSFSGTGSITYTFPDNKNITKIIVYSGNASSYENHGESNLRYRLLSSKKGSLPHYASTEKWITPSESDVIVVTPSPDCGTSKVFKHTLRGTTANKITIYVTGSHYPSSHLWRTCISEVEIFTESIQTEIDADGDGYTASQGDCDDSNTTIHPGATEICGDRIDQDCNGSDLICNNNPDSYNYYLPAFISKQNSWTGIALSNANNNLEADATVVVYNESGSQVAKVGKNLPASGKTSFLVTSSSPTHGWMLVNSSQPLSGLAFFATPPLMADIPFIKKLEKKLVIPHVAQDVNWDTIIMLCNPKDNACNINVINVNDNGGMVAQKSLTLTAKGCGSYSLGNLFTAPLGGKIYLQASSEIAAFALYSDTKSGGSYYAGINAVAEDYTIKKVDHDGDGYASDVDCNDNDSSIHPGAYDTCSDGIDQDCNGSDATGQTDPRDIDNDGDGFTENQGDCNDNDANISPVTREICGDQKDNNCDGTIDEGCVYSMVGTWDLVATVDGENYHYNLIVDSQTGKQFTGEIPYQGGIARGEGYFDESGEIYFLGEHLEYELRFTHGHLNGDTVEGMFAVYYHGTLDDSGSFSMTKR